jgi:antitoxin VapB
MALNIKNPEAHSLAQKLALLTGQSMSAAVITAVRNEISRVSQRSEPDLAERLLEIGRDCAAHMQGPPLDHGDFLYDKYGLPK